MVEQVEDLDGADEPSLPGARVPSHGGPVRYRRAHVTLSWPLSNMGPSLPNVFATVAGNLFELNRFSGLRLLDVRFPPPFLDRYHGPRFGVEGTRRLCGVWGRPVIGTIVKPSVGLTAESTAAVVGELAAGGIDFIKDDELQADGPHCPFTERLAAVMRVLDREADRDGKRIIVRDRQLGPDLCSDRLLAFARLDTSGPSNETAGPGGPAPGHFRKPVAGDRTPDRVGARQRVFGSAAGPPGSDRPVVRQATCNRGPGHRQTSGGSQRRLIYRAPIGGATHCSVA